MFIPGCYLWLYMLVECDVIDIFEKYSDVSDVIYPH